MSNENGSSTPQETVIDYFDLVTQIPVGICKFLLDKFFTILYGNEHLCSLMGYTHGQLREELGNHVALTFPPEERDSVIHQILSAHQSGEKGFRVEHHMIRRGGSSIWVLVSGSFTLPGGEPAAHAVVVDITEQKETEERLRINEARFLLALAQTDSTVFDYDIKTKVMIHGDKSAGRYGLAHETQNVPDCLVANKTVHPDSAEAFLDMYRQIREGNPTASCIIRARTTDQRYIWQRITMTSIYDNSGKAVRAVGILEDIDRQTRREARLLEQSQRDPLTGLYNKVVTENRIRSLLREENPCGALLILDLDTFKDVNDKHGHQFGDEVLIESSRRLADLFRPSDIVGRIGGDEFFVYLDGPCGREAILRKANEVRTAFTSPFSHKGITLPVTCSVGVALCPTDGTSFETLYQKADAALYEAKRSGKNQICLYAEGMHV